MAKWALQLSFINMAGIRGTKYLSFMPAIDSIELKIKNEREGHGQFPVLCFAHRNLSEGGSFVQLHARTFRKQKGGIPVRRK
jgi:hypothetical protein